MQRNRGKQQNGKDYDLFKKIRDTKGTFHAKMGSIKHISAKGFDIVNKAEIDVFLKLFCFLYDPADVGNLIFGSSAFSKTTLNIWNFTVHILLKPGLENFDHCFASMRG